MDNIDKITKYCLNDFSDLKNQLIVQNHASDFEIDFEITYVLFLASHIDGDLAYSENQFSGRVGDFLGWSEFYASLLTNKVLKQPSYQIEHLKIAQEHKKFGYTLFKLAYSMVLIDGDMNIDERAFIGNLKDFLFENPEEICANVERNVNRFFGGEMNNLSTGFTENDPGDDTVGIDDDNVSLEACMTELDNLVGLDGVRDEIKKLVSYLSIQKKRRELQLSCTNLSLHMVFTGNSGTGKTTVARLIAKIYKALGFLKKGHLVETDRSGLVGQYIGHTEIKTSEVVKKALDGILFIDEAYSLYKDSESDFGQEAIDTLVKRLEDHRDRLVVIAAGYENEMHEFINSNPGMRSRFNTYINFLDYSPEELFKIFELMSKENDYHLDEEAAKKLLQVFDAEVQKAGEGFGNGRFARNLFEQILRNQALRLSEIDNLTKEDFITVKAQDIQSSALD